MGVAFVLVVSAAVAAAQDTGHDRRGTALDQLGARLPGATVTLSGGPTSRETTTGERRHLYVREHRRRAAIRWSRPHPASAPATSDPIYVGAGARVTVDVTLQVGPLQQAVVVTAAASELLQSQTGAPVTVIDSAVISAQNKPDLQEALRLVPGAQVQQTGARGGQSSMFVRGGNSNFTKVLMDGIAVNDIGGGFDFSQIQTTGVDRIEVMRQTNSVVYGSDALTGVINIETRRGRTRVPDVAYTIDGGNLGTLPDQRVDRRGREASRLLLRILLLHDRQQGAQQRLPQRHLRRPVRRDARHQHRSQRHAAARGRQVRQPQRLRALRHRRRLDLRRRTAVRRRQGPVAVDRPPAEHDPVRLDGPDLALQQPDADRRSRSIRSASAPTTWARRSRCAVPTAPR